MCDGEISYQYQSVYLLYWYFSLKIIVWNDYLELCGQSKTCAKSLLFKISSYHLNLAMSIKIILYEMTVKLRKSIIFHFPLCHCNKMNLGCFSSLTILITSLWHDLWVMSFNPLTPKISLVILLTVCHTVLLMLVWIIWYWINL